MSLTLNNPGYYNAVLNLTRLGTELAQSNQRLTTGKRLNTAADDPAGVLAVMNFSADIARLDGIINNGSRVGSIIETADGALSEMGTLMDAIETNLLSAASATATEAEKAGYQANIDAAVDAIDRLVSSTNFNGTAILNGGYGYTVTGEDSNKLTDIRIDSSSATSGTTSMTVIGTLSQQGSVSSDEYLVALGGEVRFRLTGPEGYHDFIFAAGTGRATMATTINGFTAETGVTADSTYPDITFTTVDSGADNSVTVTITQGSAYFTMAGGQTTATDTGADTAITVNGVAANIDADTQRATFNTGTVSGSMVLSDSYYADPTSSTTFSVSGTGANLRLGASALDVIDFGQSSLSSSDLGCATLGYLSSLKTGGGNDIASGNLTTAASIALEASNQVSLARARWGATKTYSVDSYVNALSNSRTALVNARSSIEDVNFVEETANNDRLEAMMEIAATVLSTLNYNTSNILALLE